MRDSNFFRSLCGLFLAISPLCALDPDRSLSQYVRTRWSTVHGVPRGPVYAIDQTPDGYLWIGTQRGLIRFDGFEFTHINVPAPEDVSPLSHVLGLLADREGGVWARMRRPSTTLFRYFAGNLQDVLRDVMKVGASVSAVARSHDGNPMLWLLRGEGSAVIVRNGSFETVAAPREFSRSPVLAIAQTADGFVWAGTRDAGLFRMRGQETTPVTNGLPDLKVNTLVTANGGRELWIGTDTGLVRWNGEKLTRDGIPDSLQGVQVLTMTLDRHGNLWAGTNSNGLLRLNTKGVTWMDGPGRTGMEAITAVLEDRDGNLWAGYENGIERIRDSVFVSYSSAEGLPSDRFGPVLVDDSLSVWVAPMEGGLTAIHGDGKVERIRAAGLPADVVYSIASAKNGGLWLGRQRGGLTFLPPDSVSNPRVYTIQDGLPQNSVYAVAETEGGDVWAGTLSGGAARLRNGRFTAFTSADGLASNTVVSIAEAAGGSIWFATPSGLSRLDTVSGAWRTFRTNEGLPSANINCLLQDSQQILWIGTASGLSYYRDGRVRSLATPNMPPALRGQILGIAEDRVGSLWLATATQVLRVKRQALLGATLTDADLRDYTVQDGLRGVEGVKRHRTMVADAMGRIWVSLSQGVSVVNPLLPMGGNTPASVVIRSLSVDGKALPVRDSGIRVPGGTQRVEIGFAGLSLAMPERIRYRYRMESFDRDWNAPVSTREAVYTNLGPGSYRFRVSASNPEGEWSDSVTSISFTIEPLFWQTLWFRLLAVVGTVLAVIAVYQFRLRRITSTLNVRFEERLAERTRIAQELHDTLLQGFLSASMQLHVAAERLPDESKVKPAILRVQSLMGQVIDEGRNAVHGLRSDEEQAKDLAESLSGVQAEMAAESPDRAQPQFHLVVEGEVRTMHPLLRDEIYRIGREALVNAFRHADAEEIGLEIHYGEREFRMTVRDNGRGVGTDVLRSGREGHWGLPGMRERAEKIGGRFAVRSRPRGGTEVELVIPGAVAFPSPASDGWPRRLLAVLFAQRNRKQRRNSQRDAHE